MASLKHHHKFSDTVPIKRWGLCPPPYNLLWPVTALTIRTWQKWCHVTSKTRSQKGIHTISPCCLGKFAFGALSNHLRSPASCGCHATEDTYRFSGQHSQLSPSFIHSHSYTRFVNQEAILEMDLPATLVVAPAVWVTPGEARGTL